MRQIIIVIILRISMLLYVRVVDRNLRRHFSTNRIQNKVYLCGHADGTCVFMKIVFRLWLKSQLVAHCERPIENWTTTLNTLF